MHLDCLVGNIVYQTGWPLLLETPGMRFTPGK